MENTSYIEELETLQEQVSEILKNSVTDEFYETWADTFDIESIDDNKIVIAYHGSNSLKTFKKECKEILHSCICSVVGYRKTMKIRKKEAHKVSDTNLKKNIKAAKFFAVGIVFVGIALAFVIVTYNYIGNRNFRESFYSASSLKADKNIRVVQISDLHTSRYGKNNEKLISRIEKLNPDVILCTGDIIDSSRPDVDYVINLGLKLSKIAPSYYIYGNNEVEFVYGFPLNEKELDKKLGIKDFSERESGLLEFKDEFEETIEKTGMKVLKNEKDTIEVGSVTIDVYGVLTSNPSSFWSYGEENFLNYTTEDTDNLKITAIHEPFIFEDFNHDFWGDLLVCGHTHGGEIRVPLLGPLYTHEGGLFPERSGKYVYGRYDVSGKPLIVSSGLSNKNIFRINNQPELVIIDINKF